MKDSFHCNNCRYVLSSEHFNHAKMFLCPKCGIPSQIAVFPAYFKEVTPGKAGEDLLVDHEASCFYHPGKKAVILCDTCGRFLCSLCDIELHDQHLCPNCLESGKKKKKIKNLEKHRTLYDALTLRIAIYPIFMWPITIITAPVAFFMALRYWNAPSSLTPRRTKLRFSIAILVASLQLLGWGAFFVGLLL